MAVPREVFDDTKLHVGRQIGGRDSARWSCRIGRHRRLREPG
jgi:hypothetical protein